MFRKLGLVGGALGLLAIAACTPTSSYQGFQAIDVTPGEVKVGLDSRSTVLARLGTPTATSTFDKNLWFYMSQVSNKTAFYEPRVTRREVVAITFDPSTQQVASVDTYTLRDGRVIAYNGRETPTRGRQLSALEQLLGSINGASGLPPDQNQTPGSHPDDRR
jgi:outer membrane protein assembly factor BamE (lipoprotein component of BamABCDE complex)